MTDYLIVINIILFFVVLVIIYRVHKKTQSRLRQLEKKFLEYLKLMDK